MSSKMSKHYHPFWQNQHLWLWQGCWVNAHCWCNRLIDEGTDPRMRGLKKRTLVEDVLEGCDDLLEWALDLERSAGKKSNYRQTKQGKSPMRTIAKKKAVPQVIISSKGSPTRHPPVTFKQLNGGKCLVWQVPCVPRQYTHRGCGHEDCGHLHRNDATHDCWTRWHKATAAEREAFKQKRAQPPACGPAVKLAKRQVMRWQGARRASALTVTH